MLVRIQARSDARQTDLVRTIYQSYRCKFEDLAVVP